ncbi:MAG: hypothetical protein KIT82_23065, partial [Bradyrhizobium sp.]|nr:hypothetical protein [Bradyrhizobium sp.]
MRDVWHFRHDGQITFRFTEMRQVLPRKIFCFTEIEIGCITPRSPRRREGRSRDRHRAWRGLRWTLAASGGFFPLDEN